jgi:hypothetical protein
MKKIARWRWQVRERDGEVEASGSGDRDERTARERQWAETSPTRTERLAICSTELNVMGRCESQGRITRRAVRMDIGSTR